MTSEKNNMSPVFIAVCDDDIGMTGQIEAKILALAESVNICVHIDLFFSANKLISNLAQDQYYDIIYLDIEMDGIDGIRAGDYLRTKCENTSSLLIYVSSHKQYQEASFENQVFQFLTKPLEENKFNNTLLKALKQVAKFNESLVFKYNQTIHKVRLRDIVLFESQGRKIIVNTLHGKMEFHQKINQLNEILDSIFFVQIQRSFIVNLSYVTSINAKTCTLINGDNYNVGRMYASEVNRKRIAYYKNFGCTEVDLRVNNYSEVGLIHN